MKRLSFALAIALCMTAFVAAPTAAQESCQTAAEGLTVCDENGDGEPELVRFEASQEDTGSLEIRYENSTSFFGNQRTVEATGQTADQSPAGDKETTVRLICAYDGSDVPCTALRANAWAGSPSTRGPSPPPAAMMSARARRLPARSRRPRSTRAGRTRARASSSSAGASASSARVRPARSTSRTACPSSRPKAPWLPSAAPRPDKEALSSARTIRPPGCSARPELREVTR